MESYDFNEAINECPQKFEKEFASCNILKAMIASNGPQGGDASHGSVMCFKLQDLGSTSWDVNVKSDEYGCQTLEIVLRGDTELDTFANALSWAAAHANIMNEKSDS